MAWPGNRTRVYMVAVDLRYVVAVDLRYMLGRCYELVMVTTLG